MAMPLPDRALQTISEDAQVWLSAAGLSVKSSYRVDEVAKLLEVGVRTVHTMVARGDLDAVRGNQQGQYRTPTRIPLPSLLRLLDSD
jgi:excisionase family DNA binding protein